MRVEPVIVPHLARLTSELWTRRHPCGRGHAQRRVVDRRVRRRHWARLGRARDVAPAGAALVARPLRRPRTPDRRQRRAEADRWRDRRDLHGANLAPRRARRSRARSTRTSTSSPRASAGTRAHSCSRRCRASSTSSHAKRTLPKTRSPAPSTTRRTTTRSPPPSSAHSRPRGAAAALVRRAPRTHAREPRQPRLRADRPRARARRGGARSMTCGRSCAVAR